MGEVMTQYFNKITEKQKRRQLRNNLTQAERVVWAKLRDKQMGGHKFRRQYSVDSYVVDFYCPVLKLAVEIDGDSHFEEGVEAYDQQRQAFIENFGIRFLRFTNREVFENLEGVLEAIRQSVKRLN